MSETVQGLFRAWRACIMEWIDDYLGCFSGKLWVSDDVVCPCLSLPLHLNVSAYCSLGSTPIPPGAASRTCTSSSPVIRTTQLFFGGGGVTEQTMARLFCLPFFFSISRVMIDPWLFKANRFPTKPLSQLGENGRVPVCVCSLLRTKPGLVWDMFCI